MEEKPQERLEKQEIGELESPLLEKLIKVYYESGETAEVSLDSRELRQLILLLKYNIAQEKILDYELFSRREDRQNFRNSMKKQFYY